MTLELVKIAVEQWYRGVLVDESSASGARVVIGRAATSSIRSELPGIEPEHAVIETLSGGLTVKGYGPHTISHNGDRLPPLTRMQLCTGDVLEIGEVRFVVDAMYEPAPPRELPVLQGPAVVDEHERHRRLLAAAALVANPNARSDALLQSSDSLATAEVVARYLDRDIAVADARELCVHVAAHPELAVLLPTLANLPGWSMLAAFAFGHANASPALTRAMLGHDFWRVRMASAFAIRRAGERGRAASAVRRSFVASDFSPSMSTTGSRPGAVLDYRPDLLLPTLPSLADAARSACADLAAAARGIAPASSPTPLRLGELERRLVTDMRERAVVVAHALLAHA